MEKAGQDCVELNTDDVLWELVVAAQKSLDEAQLAQRSSPDNADLATRARLRDRVAETTLAFTRLTNQWQKHTRGES
jgi:hypothetical protein